MELTRDFIEEFLEYKGVRAILKKAKLPTKWEFELEVYDYDGTCLTLYEEGGAGEYFNVQFSDLPGCCGGTVIHSPEFNYHSSLEERKAFFELALKIVAIQAWELRNAGSTVICTTIANQKHFVEVLEASRFRCVGEHQNANTSSVVTTWWKGINRIKDSGKFMETYEEPEEPIDEDDSAGLNEAIGKCNCPGCRAGRTQVPGETPKKKPRLRL